METKRTGRKEKRKRSRRKKAGRATGLIKKKTTVVELAPTGSVLANLALSGTASAGMAWDKVLNIAGDSSSGKTALAAEIIAACCFKYGDEFDWEYDDVENGFSFDTLKMYGIEILPPKDPKTGRPRRSTTVEQLIIRMRKRTEEAYNKGKNYFIYVVDSLDSLTSIEELRAAEIEFSTYGIDDSRLENPSNEKEKGSYNLGKQKAVNRMFRVATKRIKIPFFTFIVISQVREKINRYITEYTWHCKRVLRFYSSQVIFLKEVDRTEKFGRATNVAILMKVIKNKVALPFRSCFLVILLDWGLDDVASCVDFYYDLRTKGGKLTSEGKKQGRKKLSIEFDDIEFDDREDLIEYIYENKKQLMIKKLASKKWKEIEYKIATKRDRKY